MKLRDSFLVSYFHVALWQHLAELNMLGEPKTVAKALEKPLRHDNTNCFNYSERTALVIRAIPMRDGPLPKPPPPLGGFFMPAMVAAEVGLGVCARSRRVFPSFLIA